MIPSGMQWPFPRRISTLLSAPNAVTSIRLAGCLVPAVLFTASIAITAAAQEAQQQTDGYGTGVISGTLEHAGPRPRVVFSDTPPASREGTQEQSPAIVKPEGIEDDFDNNTPTAWWIYTGQIPAQVTSILSSDKARIIDLQVDSVSPFLLTVTLVENTGAYAKEWWWYYGLPQAQVTSYLTANNGRLISLKAYDIGGGQVRYAVVMIHNTGADAKAWWWYYGESTSGITSALSTHNARLIAVDAYAVGSDT